MEIIVDRKRKRKSSDDQWNDPLGVDQAREAKANTIEIDTKQDNPIDKFLARWGDTKLLIGKRVWAKKDKSFKIIDGKVVNVYPSRFLLVKIKNGTNVPVEFSRVLSMT